MVQFSFLLLEQLLFLLGGAGDAFEIELMYAGSHVRNALFIV